MELLSPILRAFLLQLFLPIKFRTYPHDEGGLLLGRLVPNHGLEQCKITFLLGRLVFNHGFEQCETTFLAGRLVYNHGFEQCKIKRNPFDSGVAFLSETVSTLETPF